jgi:glucose/arabinose dehydrogenase
MLRLPASFLLCALFALCSPPLAADEPSSDGQTLYGQYCSACHGQNLEGINAPSLIDGVWIYGGRGNIARNIRFGIVQQGMPAFGEVLTRDQINAISAYIREAEKSAGATKPPIPDTLETYDYRIRVERWVEGLRIPWSIAFPDTATALITERPGRLRVVKNGVLRPEPVSDTPQVLHQGQGGLMDVAVDPAYSENGWVYLSYSHALRDTANSDRAPAMTRLVRGRLKNNVWTDQQVIYEAPHETYGRTRHHYGCRIVFDKAGYLYFPIGDRGIPRHAQDLSRPGGKIHRIHRSGRIPSDNPFLEREGALPTVFSFGQRNPQGLAVHPLTGALWESEHGPMGGDEINLIRAGINYGWPTITYGRNYNGTLVSEFERNPGLEQPVLFWRPSIAVCGIDFYRGSLFPRWKNRLLVGALAFEEVRVLTVENGRVIYQETILKNAGRVRDVASGPDGAIYVVLNSPGTVLRLTPIASDDAGEF